MKLSLQLKLIGVIPIIIVLGMSSFLLYESAKNYGKTLEIKKNIIYTTKLTKILKELSIENGFTSLYLNTSGEIPITDLVDQRIKVDNIIENYINYINTIKTEDFFNNILTELYFSSLPQTKEKYVINNNEILEKLKELKKLRKEINTFNISFEKNFNGNFSETTKIIKNEVLKLNKFSPDIKLKKMLDDTLSIIETIENSSNERDFLSKPLTSKTILTKEEFANWFKYWSGAENLPQIEKIEDNITYKSELENILYNPKNEKLLKEVLNIKLDILENLYNEKYPIKPVDWFKISSEKILILEDIQDIVLKHTNLVIQNELKEYQNNLLLNLSIWIFTTLLTLIGLRTTKISENNLNKLGTLFKKLIILNKKTDDIDLNSQKGIDKAYRMIEESIQQAKDDSEAAKEASVTKSLFLANMSHEIRTPLNGILGFTTLLKKTKVNDEQSEFISIIEKSGKSLLEIISNILDLSKIESNKIEMENIDFNPLNEFENAVEIYAAKASEKNIDLSFQYDPEIPNSLKGDPTKIQQVLVNLMSNAIKFTPENGNIHVEIKKISHSNKDGKKEVKLFFAVKDSGDGIPKNKQDKIFESFSQADSSVTRQFGGTGLGLTISKEFIALMGGKLSVESEVGHGAKFYFNIKLETNVDLNNLDYDEYKNKFKDFKVDFITPISKNKKTDNCIRNYLKHLGVKINNIEINDKYIETINNSESNFSLLDYDYFKECSPKCINKIKKKIALYTKTTNQNEVYELNNDNLFKISYEPMNYSKIIKILEEFAETKGELKLKKDKTISLDLNQNLNFNANILVCEDNTVNQKLIKITLEDLGCKVDIANNGLSGFNLYSNNREKYDMIFMDIQMPILNGVEATQIIKQYDVDNSNYKTPPIIALTANALKGDRDKFLKLGLDEYASKPLIIEELISLMQLFIPNKIIKKEENTIKEKLNDRNSIKKIDDVKIGVLRDKELTAKIFKKQLLSIGVQEENIILLEKDLKTNESLDLIFMDDLNKITNFQDELFYFMNNNPNTKLIGIIGRNEFNENIKKYFTDFINNNINKNELNIFTRKYI